MTTFDEILPAIRNVLTTYRGARLSEIDQLLVNRDLNGRVRLIVSDNVRSNDAALETLHAISADLLSRLGSRAYPVEHAVLFEVDLVEACRGASQFALQGFANVWVLDRLATDTDWANIAPESSSAPRIVFFSIKGGVGRSTALAATAWSLAQAGKRVLVVDLDLESPGLSSNLLPEDRRPTYGVTDWLVEDLLENGQTVFEDMIAISALSREGEIYVTPAHGREPGEYVAKLGRVWMGKRHADGTLEAWPQRLVRLLNALETRVQPDVVLIDSRAGIDEVAASSVAQLGASLVLLFAIDGSQTWTGYQVLFQHWNRAGKAREIRERLQCVGAMIPDDEGRVEYFDSLREHAWAAFSELYDEVPAGAATAELFNYDETDESAPHYPWPVKWSRSFAAIQSLHTRLDRVDADAVQSIFGELIGRLTVLIDGSGEGHE